MKIIQKYCYECGCELQLKNLEYEGEIPFCPNCKQYRFPFFNVAVSMIVINKSTNKILLIKQYGKNHNILVAGYLNRGERQEEAVIREVKEETGMSISSMKFNRTEFFEPSNTLMCNYTVFVENDKELNPNYEIDSYGWYDFEQAKSEIYPNSLASFFLNSYLEEL